MLKKILSILIISSMLIGLVACNYVDNASSKVSEAANDVKQGADNVADSVKGKMSEAKTDIKTWYDNLDFKKFKDGWDKSSEFISAHYSAAVSSEYVSSVQNEIEKMKIDINSSAGSARGTAQVAGYLAEKWATDTFNINAKANGSSDTATVVGSNELGSVDVTTSYGENASLKYYQNANSSAQAQAQDLLSRYYQYCTESSDPVDFKTYIDNAGYDPELMDELVASNTPVYEGQTRIIPADQLENATSYLKGKSELATINGENAAIYEETLNNLKDRLESPDGIQSEPITYEEMQAVAELAKEGEFAPEDFNIKLSSVIPPKYVLKQAVGTGLTTAALNTVFEVGPDVYSVIREALKTGDIDEDKLKELGWSKTLCATQYGLDHGTCDRLEVRVNSLKFIKYCVF